MRRTVAALLSALLLGCGGGDEVTIEGAPTPERDTAADVLRDAHREAMAIEDAYYEIVSEALPDLTREQAVEAGHAICGMYDDGAEWLDVLAVLTDLDIEGRPAGVLMGSAVAAFCPEHRDRSPSR